MGKDVNERHLGDRRSIEFKSRHRHEPRVLYLFVQIAFIHKNITPVSFLHEQVACIRAQAAELLSFFAENFRFILIFSRHTAAPRKPLNTQGTISASPYPSRAYNFSTPGFSHSIHTQYGLVYVPLHNHFINFIKSHFLSFRDSGSTTNVCRT